MSDVAEPNWLTITGLVFLFSGLVVLCSAVNSGSWWGQRAARSSTLGAYQRAASGLSALLIAAGLGFQLVGQFLMASLSTSIVMILLALIVLLLFFALIADMYFVAPDARSETSMHALTSDSVDGLAAEGQIASGRLRIAS
jgi:hypothetical protein